MRQSLARARADWQGFKLDARTIILALGAGAIAYVWQTRHGNKASASDTLIALAAGLVAVLALWVVEFGVAWAKAPYRIAQDEIKTLKHQNEALQTASEAVPDYLPALTNPELRERTLKLAATMRTFEAKAYEADSIRATAGWMDKLGKSDEERRKEHIRSTEELLRRTHEQGRVYRESFHGPLLAYSDEIKHRIGGGDETYWTNAHGMPAGPWPFAQAADYLERLARKLPEA